MANSIHNISFKRGLHINVQINTNNSWDIYINKAYLHQDLDIVTGLSTSLASVKRQGILKQDRDTKASNKPEFTGSNLDATQQ